MFRKKSALEKKRKQIEKELSAVSSDIRSLSKSVGGRPSRRQAGTEGGERPQPVHTGLGRDDEGLFGQSLARPSYDEIPEAQKKSRGRPPAQLHDERFVGYLANSFDSMRPLRHERKIQRNKAIVMAVFVALLLFWLLYRHFFL